MERLANQGITMMIPDTVFQRGARLQRPLVLISIPQVGQLLVATVCWLNASLG